MAGTSKRQKDNPWEFHSKRKREYCWMGLSQAKVRASQASGKKDHQVMSSEKEREEGQ